ncbi:hypothetical protein MMC07_002846 [Pseudocyphellaria aurata]|nr:hypothetical protein [Pseudocyphellaria aurata]
MNPGSETSGRSIGDRVRRLNESAHGGGSGNGGIARGTAGPIPETTKAEIGPLRIDRPEQSSPQISSSISRYPGHPFPGGQVPIPPMRSTYRPPPPTIRAQGLNTPNRQHWPQHQADPHERQTTGPAHERTPVRGPPPQRPPRPPYVPSMHPSETPGDRFRQLQPQLHRPQHPNQPHMYPEEGMQIFPHQEAPPFANMPDFPLPNVAPLNIQQPRRSANLGPPPSARKGASSYYTQNSFVAPIPEEIPEPHTSFASSHVMPSSWGEGPPHQYQGDGVYGEDPSTRSPSTDGLGSRPEDLDESTQLVRPSGSGKHKRKNKSVQATELGRAKSGKAAAGEMMNDSPKDNRLHPKILTAGARASDATIEMESQQSGNMHWRTDRITTLVPPSPGNSPYPSPTSPLPQLPSGPPQPVSPSSVDLRVNEILGNIEKGTAISPSGDVSPLSSGSFASERVARRPPPLNLSLTKEGERASQTSLPELIRRATKLAANLDRTRASIWAGSNKSSRAGSISDILAAFPSPSLATPPSIRWPPSSVTKSSTTKGEALPPPASTHDGTLHKSHARKCCGMPVWIFVLLLAIVVLLIAAAIVIPITLIVLPRVHHGAPSLASCKEKALCGNGGTNIVVDNACGCVCANGFTGSACVNPPKESCIFADLKVGEGNAVYQNATVGSGIPRLFSGARSNFSIVLDSTTILSRFSATNLSCAEENLLVTFDGKAQRRSLPMQFVMPNVDLVEKPRSATPQNPTPTIALQRLAPRADSLADFPPSDVATSNGIIVAAPSTAVPEAFPTPSQVIANPTGTTTKPSSTPSSTPSSPGELTSNGIPIRAFEFARVAVLLIFQETNLNTAVLANQRLRVALDNPKTWNLSATYATDAMLVDFAKFTVNLGNGTVVGGNV